MENNENIVSVDTLNQHFTAEELAAVMPKEETEQAEVVEESAEPQEETEQTEEPSQPDSDIVQEKPQKLKPTVIAYDRFKEVNDKAKALAAELTALKAQQPTPFEKPKTMYEQAKPESDVQVEAEAKYYATLSSNADKKARAILGVGDADLTELQFTDNPKYQALLDTRSTIVQEMHSENVKAFKVRQANEQYVTKLQNDSLFAPVYQFAIADMQDLPLKEVIKFKEAEARVTNYQGTDADFATLDKYMDDYKAKYLALNGQKQDMPFKQPTTPNKVNAPLDKADGLPRANSLSGAKSASMSWTQVEQLIRDGKADQIPQEMLAQIDPKLIE